MTPPPLPPPNVGDAVDIKTLPLCYSTWARLHKTSVTTTGIRTCTRNLSQLHEIT